MCAADRSVAASLVIVLSTRDIGQKCASSANMIDQQKFHRVWSVFPMLRQSDAKKNRGIGHPGMVQNDLSIVSDGLYSRLEDHVCIDGKHAQHMSRL